MEFHTYKVFKIDWKCTNITKCIIAYNIKVLSICFYMSVIYYDIIIIQMIRVMAERQEEQRKNVVIKEFATEKKS